MPSEEDKKQLISTLGPGAEIELQDDKKDDVVEQQTEEQNNETKTETSVQDNNQSDDSSEKPTEQPNVHESKEDGRDKQQSDGKEHEDYSEGVKKRIAKLTKKMREAERQRDEALSFAERTKKERDTLTSKISQHTGYASEME